MDMGAIVTDLVEMAERLEKETGRCGPFLVTLAPNLMREPFRSTLAAALPDHVQIAEPPEIEAVYGTMFMRASGG